MPTTLQIRPNNVVGTPTGWSILGGSATLDAALADGSEGSPVDTTYDRNSTTFDRLRLALTSPALPGAGERVTGVQVRIRGWKNTSAANRLKVSLELNNVIESKPDNWRMAQGSGAAAEYKGFIRTRDPSGAIWSPGALTDLHVQLEPQDVVDVSVSELWVNVTYVDAPVATLTAPSGTQGTTRPELDWTFSQDDGAPMTSYEVKVFTAATFALPDFDPGTAATVYASGQRLGSATSFIPGANILNGTYVAAVRTAITTVGAPHWSSWSFSAFTTVVDEPSAPVLTASPDPTAGWVDLVLTDTNNLLNRQEADFEDSTQAIGYWSAAFGNCTAVRSTTTAAHGSASCRITVTANGDASLGLQYFVRAVPGEVYEAQGVYKCATNARGAELEVRFYDASLTLIGAGTIGAAATGSTSAFVGVTCGATAPPNTAYMQFIPRIKSALATEQFYWDELKIAPLLSAWSRGGIVGRNQLTLNQSNAEVDTTGVTNRTNCVVTRQTTTAAEGAASFRMRSVGPGGMSMTTAGLLLTPAAAGQVWTSLVSIKAAATPRSCKAGMEFFDIDGNSLGVFGGGAANDNTSTFTNYTHTTTAPEGTAYVACVPLVYAVAGASEDHFADKLSLSLDSSTSWMPGGTGVVTTPILEYTDDDLAIADTDATWTPVRFTEGIYLGPDASAEIFDSECPPVTVRRYRSSIFAVEAGVTLAGDNSPTQTVTLPEDVWCLKCPELPDLNVVGVSVIGPIDTKITRNVGVFQELADPTSNAPVYPVVISGGIAGSPGALRIITRGQDEWDAINALLLTQRTLLLVSPYGDQHYIQLDADPAIELSGTPDFPRRVITFTYVEVARP